ncbi:type II toxin-antitoxin system RelE family toxin [Halovenus halobia]|uniref:type II toxin-antitoxin system RelE family toxin n=1 Tax=Halovenus halobia TaxID=3396622 RepID=UPI003F5752C5
MTSEEDWSWQFTPQAADQFELLDGHVQDRIVSKLRVGQYCLACVLNHGGQVLEIHRIEHRSGAYTADDD